jgi:hypothetical protein
VSIQGKRGLLNDDVHPMLLGPPFLTEVGSASKVESRKSRDGRLSPDPIPKAAGPAVPHSSRSGRARIRGPAPDKIVSNRRWAQFVRRFSLLFEASVPLALLSVTLCQLTPAGYARQTFESPTRGLGFFGAFCAYAPRNSVHVALYAFTRAFAPSH